MRPIHTKVCISALLKLELNCVISPSIKLIAMDCSLVEKLIDIPYANANKIGPIRSLTTTPLRTANDPCGSYIAHTVVLQYVSFRYEYRMFQSCCTFSKFVYAYRTKQASAYIMKMIQSRYRDRKRMRQLIAAKSNLTA